MLALRSAEGGSFFRNDWLKSPHKWLNSSAIFNFQATARGRRLQEWQQWEFRERLRAYLIMEDYQNILQTEVASGKHLDEAAERTLAFYKALSYLEKEHAQPEMAAVLLDELHGQDPFNRSYSMNLLIALIRLFEEKKKIDEDLDTLQHKINSLLKQLEPKVEGLEEIKIYAAYRLYLYILRDEIHSFWAYYNQLPDFIQKALSIGVYALQVMIKEEKWEQAENLLQSLVEWHGDLEVLEDLKGNIAEKSKERSTFSHQSTVFEALNH